MALVRCMTEMGMGVDVHGLDDTLAAKRAVFDALHHSSLGFARLVGATAMEDASRHAGASLRGGALRGTIVRCPAHGWRYDVCTGQRLNEPDDGVARFPVQVVDGIILVALVERSRTVMEDGRWSATTRHAMIRRVERVEGGLSLGMTRRR